MLTEKLLLVSTTLTQKGLMPLADDRNERISRVQFWLCRAKVKVYILILLVLGMMTKTGFFIFIEAHSYPDVTYLAL